jgi:anti-sigma28 factor (negative regulator of flagellin synthesis)
MSLQLDERPAVAADEVGRARLDELTATVRSGRYEVDAEQVAAAIYDRLAGR